MDNKKEEKLFKDFPTLFPGGRNVNPRESLMGFGISVGDGWEPLIRNLCKELVKVEGEKYKGEIVAHQIKEKFGILRFYTGSIPEPLSEKMFDLIQAAEDKSGKICEACGLPGSIDERFGWYVTLCSNCKKKRKEHGGKVVW